MSEESKTPRTDAEVGYCYDYTSQTELVSAHVSRQLERELAEANEREEKLKTMLLDPTTVHINMIRGTIAKLDWPTLEHIHGNHPLRAQRDALLEALQPMRDKLSEWEEIAFDGDPRRRAECENCIISKELIAIADKAIAKGGGQ